MTLAEQVSLAEVKNRLSEVVDRIEREHDRVVITKHGHPAAVIVSVEDLESLEETLEILSNPDLLAAVRDAEADVTEGRTERLTKDQALKLLPRPVTQVDQPYDIEWAGPASRALRRMPEKVATSVVEFVYGPMADNPHRTGYALRFELEGLHRARRGDYRVVYRIDDPHHRVIVEVVEHRSDVYRRR